MVTYEIDKGLLEVFKAKAEEHDIDITIEEGAEHEDPNGNKTVDVLISNIDSSTFNALMGDAINDYTNIV